MKTRRPIRPTFSFTGLLAGLALSLSMTAWLPSAHAQITDTEGKAALTMSPWVGDVGGATDLAFLKDGRAVITRKNGEVVVASADGMTLKRAAAMVTVDTGSEKGLLGVVVDSADNLYFFASNGPSNADKHRVYKGRAAADGTVTIDLTNPVVTGGLEGPANHDGGGLIIHKGQLYVSVGDTGSNATPPTNKYGACLNKANGKILRVNLDGTIPTDNPLSNLAMVTSCASPTGGTFAMAAPDKRIYTWGFRNPWRFWIDSDTDLLWIGDVGEGDEEEITVGGLGANHGWPFNEGKVKYAAPLGGLKDCQEMTPATDCVAPQDTYKHEGREASVTGGLIPPKGCGWGAFENRYFFGDYNRHTLYTIDVTPDRRGAVAGSRKPFGDARNPVSFRMGPGGAMYVVTSEGGIINKIVPKTVPATCQAAAAVDAGGGGNQDAGAGSGGAAGGGAPTPPGTGGTGTTNPGTGGSTPGTGGSSGGGATASGSDGGCSCNLSREGQAGSAGLGVVAAGLAAAVIARGRRRRRKASPTG